MDEKFRKLIELGAGEFEHVDDSLIAHLEGTRCLLKEWHAPDVLQEAGLYHAAYGTSAFASQLFDLSQRKDVAAIIGVQAEEIVYHYCACDREVFFAQFGQNELPLFYDRITQQQSILSKGLLCQLCELTVATDTEIAISNSAFVSLHGGRLLDLFTRMQGFLSPAAQRKVQHVFTAQH